jgi:hypothetical protein
MFKCDISVLFVSLSPRYPKKLYASRRKKQLAKSKVSVRASF